MLQYRRIVSTLILGLMASLLVGCQDAQQDREFEYLPVYGDGSNDISPVVAEVNGVKITEFDLQLRFDELTESRKAKFRGPEGQRLLLKDMVDDLLLVQGAVDQELYNTQAVARTLISQRRDALTLAMKNLYLLKGKEPEEEDLQDHYMANRSRYKSKGLVQARHIELTNEDDAWKAYNRIATGEWKDRFEVVCKEMSVNEKTKAKDGELGWFNAGGYVENVDDYKAFALRAYACSDGLNRPFRIGNRWHVVEIRRREPDRNMTYNEARLQVLSEVTPGFRNQIVDDWLVDARKNAEITFQGPYAPGQGLSPDELLAKARLLADPMQKMEVLDMIYADFPESDRADDALFLAGNTALDSFHDKRAASRYLARLLREYPDSELVSDAQFLLDNLDNPAALHPSSIEDLRK